MTEYRWDLSIRRPQNQDAPRCPAERWWGWNKTYPLQCEYIAHGGTAHSAQDGGVQWTEEEK